MDAMMTHNNMFNKILDTLDEYYKDISANITSNAIKQGDKISTLHD